MERKNLAGDLWGGLASMLVALPASIAFGVGVYAPLGPGAAAQGASAGLLGATALGIIAPLFGGTERLITAPCAPAAAVMGSLAMELAAHAHSGRPAAPEHALVIMTLVALISGSLQILFGLLRGGTLIKYVPYPVVTGYLSGVGVVIFLKQIPDLFGFPKSLSMLAGLSSPGQWEWHSLAVAAATIAAVLLAPRLTKTVPAPIVGLAVGVLTYFALGLLHPRLLSLAGNRLVIGRLGGASLSFGSALSARWAAATQLGVDDLAASFVPALTLAVLLSIDTLKTCVVVDAMTRSRHDSNREMLGQGLANLGAAVLGGMPGSGTSGPTLVNVASGGRTRLSSVIEGGLALLAYLLLGPLIAWAPLASLAAILLVVAYRMFDWGSVRLLKQRSTQLDFVVIATVVAVAVGVGLITASGVGIALAIVLFIREEVRGTVIHRKLYGNHVFSRQKRLPEETAVLERKGDQTVVYELEGNLFFGTTDQLVGQLGPDVATRRFVILDMRRVRSVDFTAIHMLEQMHAQLAERNAHLVFSNLPKALPTGRDLRSYFDEVGLVKPARDIRIFNQLSDALEWAEDCILQEEGRGQHADEVPMTLEEVDFVQGRKEETLRALEAALVERSFTAGQTVFRQGEASDEIYFIRRGRVKIFTALKEGGQLHIATFGRGDFFGDMAFLDSGVRSADAVATEPTDLVRTLAPEDGRGHGAAPAPGPAAVRQAGARAGVAPSSRRRRDPRARGGLSSRALRLSRPRAGMRGRSCLCRARCAAERRRGAAARCHTPRPARARCPGPGPWW